MGRGAGFESAARPVQSGCPRGGGGPTVTRGRANRSPAGRPTLRASSFCCMSATRASAAAGPGMAGPGKGRTGLLGAWAVRAGRLLLLLIACLIGCVRPGFSAAVERLKVCSERNERPKQLPSGACAARSRRHGPTATERESCLCVAHPFSWAAPPGAAVELAAAMWSGAMTGAGGDARACACGGCCGQTAVPSRSTAVLSHACCWQGRAGTHLVPALQPATSCMVSWAARNVGAAAASRGVPCKGRERSSGRAAAGGGASTARALCWNQRQHPNGWVARTGGLRGC